MSNSTSLPSSTPQQKSRWNHFVTQSWQRRFSFDGKHVWSYDADEYYDVNRSSTKPLMAMRDLYVIDPTNTIDDSYEKIFFQVVDDGCKFFFDLLVNGERSKEIKEELSYILAIQIVRTPAARKAVFNHTKHILDHIMSVFDFADYAAYRAYASAKEELLTEREFKVIKAIHGSKERLRRQLEAAPASLGSDHPALPWIDMATDPATIRPIADALEKMRWEIAVADEPAFVLGDAGVVYHPGSTWDLGVRVPVASRVALWIEPVDNPPPGIETKTLHAGDAMALNYWSAAQAEQWVIAETEALLREAVEQRRSRHA